MLCSKGLYIFSTVNKVKKIICTQRVKICAYAHGLVSTSGHIIFSCSFSGAQLDWYFVNSLQHAVYLKSFCGTDIEWSSAIVILHSHHMRRAIKFQQGWIRTPISCDSLIVSNCQSRQRQSPWYSFFVAVMDATTTQQYLCCNPDAICWYYTNMSISPVRQHIAHHKYAVKK